MHLNLDVLVPCVIISSSPLLLPYSPPSLPPSLQCTIYHSYEGQRAEATCLNRASRKTMKYFISSLTLVGEYFVIGIAPVWYVSNNNIISVQLSYSVHYRFVCNLSAARRERWLSANLT